MNKPIIKRPGLRGFILAAGYGTRLAPVTDHIPKPLLPMGKATLLDNIIHSMDRAGIDEIAANTHHLGEQIAHHLAARADASRFAVFPEKEILGTGGALDGARSFLAKGDYFLLHNGDVLSDLDLAELVRVHENSDALATLALAHWPAVNSVIMADEGNETGPILAIAGMPDPLPAGSGRCLTYTGIGVFSCRLLDDIGPGFSSIITPLVQAMKDNPGCVQGFAPARLQWDDLGTLARWLSAWENHQQDHDPNGGRLQVSRLTGHGSDRRFWRLAAGNWSAIAVKNPENEDHPARGLGADPEDEFNYFVSIGKFLQNHNLGAPGFLSVDEGEKTALMEDLGPESLYSVANSPERKMENVARTYRKVMDRLVCLQEHTPEALEECPEAVQRSLDEPMLRWETEYFTNNYLINHLGFDKHSVENLEELFGNLAVQVAAQPKVLVHRDFQSQNIMLSHGVPRLVDFQGMRLGPIGYDVMSLAFDPYIDLALKDRWLLVEYYCHKVAASEKLADLVGVMPDERALLKMATEAGLQRLMQALGAYTFLGLKKGKSGFLVHIPRGKAMLEAILARHRSYDDSMAALGPFLN
jgi:aminoglycoside/choline kinase family phosphotransferase/CTP:molybdopterin cytidylyltransferase MocA